MEERYCQACAMQMGDTDEMYGAEKDGWIYWTLYPLYVRIMQGYDCRSCKEYDETAVPTCETMETSIILTK